MQMPSSMHYNRDNIPWLLFNMQVIQYDVSDHNFFESLELIASTSLRVYHWQHQFTVNIYESLVG